MSIQQAIAGRFLLSFSYDGYSRVVEPHCYGRNKKGDLALRAYQVGGGSESGEYIGWKIFKADEMRGVQLLQKQFAGARPGYKRNDTAFSTILAAL